MKKKKIQQKDLEYCNSLLHKETSARYDNVFLKKNYQYCESAVSLTKRIQAKKNPLRYLYLHYISAI